MSQCRSAPDLLAISVKKPLWGANQIVSVSRETTEKDSITLRIDGGTGECIYLNPSNIVRSNSRDAMIESQNGEMSSGSAGLLDWKLGCQADQNIVVIQTSGPIDKSSFPVMLAAAVAEAERRQTTRILADHRKSLLKLNPLEIYYAPKVMVSSGAHSDYILALVFAEKTEDNQFLENVCRNSGLTVAVFTDNKVALQWLSESARQQAGHQARTCSSVS